MRKSLLTLAVLGAIAVPTVSQAEAALASAWAFSSNVAFTNDYYVRGLSQTYHKPALQGGFDDGG